MEYLFVNFQVAAASKAFWEGKKYKMEKSEGFDEYMKELGIGRFLRAIGNSVVPSVELIKNGDEYTFNTMSTFKNTQIKFKEGEEFDEVTIDGRHVKGVVTFDGPNKMIHKQGGEKPIVMIREFDGDTMVLDMSAGDVKCKRFYKAI